MKRIAMIPIDNRPVCYTLPQMIAAINEDIKLILPPRTLLGSLTENANREALFDWLEELTNIDYLIISADTLIYGGLIPSRRSNTSKEEIEKQLLKLRNILLKKENCKTMFFSSIMRISNNNYNEEEKEYWSEYGTKIFEYSYNLHKAEVEGSDPNKALEIAKQIPKEILIDWLSTRERNFYVNKIYTKMYDDGLFDTLIFSKDDCAKYGFNVKEARYFEFLAKSRKKMFVKTGADEIPITLLSRCISDERAIKIAPIYTNESDINLISKYEDLAVKDSVISQIQTAGGTVSTIDKADLILYINNFKSQQGELVMDIETEPFTGDIQTFTKPFCVVDILNANGADNNFVEKLLEKKWTDNFYGYAAWNTTGNSLGSGISAAICKLLADKNNETAFNSLQLIRFLDDWAYQANLRKKFKEQGIKDKEEIKESFKKYEKRIEEKLGLPEIEIEYKFPWNRYFEIEIEIMKE